MKIIIIAAILLPIFISFNSYAENETNETKLEPLILEILDPQNFDFELNIQDQRLKSKVIKVKEFLTNKSDNLSLECKKFDYKPIKNLPRGLKDEELYLNGIIAEICKDPKKATSFYQESLDLKNNNPFVIFRLAASQIKSGNLSKVKNLLQEAEWQGFSETHIIDFLNGLIISDSDKPEKSIYLYEKSLKSKADFLPSAKALYHQRVKLRNNTKELETRQKLDLLIPQDLGRLHHLEPNNLGYAFDYARYLLSTGDALHKPNKLVECDNIVTKWATTKNPRQGDFALLKVQLLDKQSKSSEIKPFIEGLIQMGFPLSPGLKAKLEVLEKEDENQN